MSDKITKSPLIRFVGFTDTWEQRKLGEMLEERNEQIPENDEYPLMSFVQGAGVSPKGDRYDRSFLVKADNKKYKKTELGDFIYSSNNLETGSIGFNRTGNAVISPVYSIFSSKSELESRFIGILSTRKDFIAKMIRFRQGVVYGQWRIHEKDFLDIKITVPRHEEQKEIIDFFLNLDNLITLHQRELELLKDTKKCLLQKMFPKDGANVPEIRFEGFTDAWEQRTFSELVTRVSKSSEVDELPRVEYEDIVSGQGKLNKDIFAKESDKKGIEFDVGYTLFGKLRPYLQNWLLADFRGIAVGDWWVLRPNEMDNKFIYSLIQSNKYQTVANLSTGTKMPRSDWNVVSQTEFSVPTDKGEQAKIGQLFNQLDHLITLHQRELNSLENLKKSLLQQMFI